MTKKYESIFKPLKIGSKILKNRLVVPAMDSAMCEEDGTIGQMACDYYGHRAQGGYAMVISEIAAIDHRGMGMPGQPRLYSDTYDEGLKNLARSIQDGGALALVQLHHAGRETTKDMIGERPFSPSVLPSPVYREEVHEMTTEEVEDMVASYIYAAKRVKDAGFEGVEFHAAHGYMGLQFLSPRTNKRIDKYGGDILGRARFALEIIEGIRELCGPEFLVLVRIDSIEGRVGGLQENEALVFAKLMEEAGADAINISAGTYAAWDIIVPPSDREDGWNWEAARRVKEYVNIPVGLAGRLSTPHTINNFIQRGDIDFACLGRTSIADPFFPKKLREGREEEIVPCIGCTQRCMSFNDHDTLQEGDWGVSCIFNPFSNNREEVQYGKADQVKKVVIAGAGIGGLYTAQIAAERGHDVLVIEKNGRNRAGGDFLLAAYPPFKQDITRVIKHYLYMCDKYGVKFLWETLADDDLIRSLSPDVFIDATGAEVIDLNLPGFDQPEVYRANDVLEGQAILGQSALVIGGGMVGMETAEFCQDYCQRVTVIEQEADVAKDLYMTVRDAMLQRFKNHDIDIHVSTKALRLEGRDLVADQAGQEVIFKDHDNIVVAVGSRSVARFENKEDLAKEVYTIGDAKRARSALEAIFEGGMLAKDL